MTPRPKLRGGEVSRKANAVRGWRRLRSAAVTHASAWSAARRRAAPSESRASSARNRATPAAPCPIAARGIGMLGAVRGGLVGAEVVSTAIYREWLHSGRVRRWYEFVDSQDHSSLDTPERTTVMGHLRTGPQHWTAANSEAVTLIGNGFVHALV